MLHQISVVVQLLRGGRGVWSVLTRLLLRGGSTQTLRSYSRKNYRYSRKNYRYSRKNYRYSRRNYRYSRRNESRSSEPGNSSGAPPQGERIAQSSQSVKGDTEQRKALPLTLRPLRAQSKGGGSRERKCADSTMLHKAVADVYIL